MKFGIALNFLFIPQFSLADQPSIKKFVGTYTGLVFSDSSPSAISEIEIKIEENKITSRVATGSKIEEKVQDIVLTPMPADQVVAKRIFQPQFVKNWAVFTTDGGKPYYLFNLQKKGKTDVSVIVKLADDTLMGIGQSQLYGQPIMELYGDKQVKEGVIDGFATKLGGKLPRLSNDGKVPEKQ